MAEGKLDVRVLSIWQPWASLLVHGFKKIETRPAKTSHIGPDKVYLIQSGMKWSKWQHDLCLQDPFFTDLGKIHYPNGFPVKNKHISICHQETSIILPLGHIVGMVNFTECLKIEVRSSDKAVLENGLSVYGKEIEYGNYTTGNFAWLNDLSKPCDPLPFKGAQGYYNHFNGNINNINFQIFAK